ncbi:monovalent cation/H(+) antiporter subunit G [uncultured Devosia sp.]|uniref:monovalent cation/H(+) antiporter subunit G n=1 Tax=uncultured Devosia sp. TaxID=211434 RepID=UPI0035CA71DB
MMAEIARYVGAVLLSLGSVFGLIAAVGVLRLPDLYTRMHAASKAGAVGGGMILLAVALACLDGAVASRAVIGIGFLLVTTPVSAHLLARASLKSGDRPAQITVSNDLDIVNKAPNET